MCTRLLTLTIAACSLLGSSCDHSSGLFPVSGKVLVNGVPASGATVTFVRKDSTNPLKDPTPQGVVEDDGVFTLSGPGGDGALPGEYVVLIEWKEGAGTQRGRAPSLNAPDRLKKKYLDPNNPLLTAKIEAKSNSLPPFELQ